MTLRQNPIFVAAWTAFCGALAEQLTERLQSGHFEFDGKGWESMLGTAATTAVIAIMHLYTKPPATPPADPAQPAKQQ